MQQVSSRRVLSGILQRTGIMDLEHRAERLSPLSLSVCVVVWPPTNTPAVDYYSASCFSSGLLRTPPTHAEYWAAALWMQKHRQKYMEQKSCTSSLRGKNTLKRTEENQRKSSTAKYRWISKDVDSVFTHRWFHRQKLHYFITLIWSRVDCNTAAATRQTQSSEECYSPLVRSKTSFH